MAVSLSKGAKVSLDKAAADSGISGGIQQAICGLGWDTNRYDGGHAFDLDAAAFLLGANGKVLDQDSFIFYGHLVGQGVQHTGDNLTGEGEGDDEQIIIDLTAVPANCEKIAFSVTIYKAEERKQNFGMVDNAFVRLCEKNSGTEFIRYDLGEDFSIETAVVVGELYKHNGEWKFNAIGSGYQGGLNALCQQYGVETN